MQFPATPIDHDVIDLARAVKDDGARKAMLEELSQKKKHKRASASEPQYTSVINLYHETGKIRRWHLHDSSFLLYRRETRQHVPT